MFGDSPAPIADAAGAGPFTPKQSPANKSRKVIANLDAQNGFHFQNGPCVVPITEKFPQRFGRIFGVNRRSRDAETFCHPVTRRLGKAKQVRRQTELCDKLGIRKRAATFTELLALFVCKHGAVFLARRLLSRRREDAELHHQA